MEKFINVVFKEADMIITISGRPGSGKSAVAKVLAKKLSLAHFSTGDFMREMAAKQGMSLLELSKKAQNDGGKIDTILDDRLTKLGKTKDNFVMDARLGFHFIPHSIRVFLDVDPDIAAARVFKQKRGGVEKAASKSLAEAKKEIQKRTQIERKRYKKYYGVDYLLKKNYDLVVDTNKLSVAQVASRLEEFMKNK
jgi:CMP/dCMP kinase